MREVHRFFATTAKGMEPTLVQELEALLGKKVELSRSGVAFEGTLEDAYRVCLWSRIANRVLLPLKTFAAPDPDKLYGGVRSIHWSDHLSPKQTLAIDFSSTLSQITHTQYGALKSKDAICDQFRTMTGVRPSVDVHTPDVRINIYVYRDEATVSLDLSGDSLHRRGYREEGAKAPLKETLAATILSLGGWSKGLPGSDPQEGALVDPMCGSGTLPLEAALMAARIAPGISRKYYGFNGWLGHVPAVWKRLLQEAESVQIRDAKLLPKIVGYDEDFRAVKVALSNLERAGLRGKVHFEKRELSQCESPGTTSGLFVVNPPYGERLGDVDALMPLYKQIGDTMKQKFQGWKGLVFTGSPDLAKVVGLKASRRHVLYNGPIECRLLEYDLYSGRLPGA